MTVIGFPGKTPDTTWTKPKTLEDWPWEKDLGKPHMDINDPLDSAPPANDLARYKEKKLLDSLKECNELKSFCDTSPASEILHKASGLIDGERNIQHGDRKTCHTLIARLWTAYLGVQIRPAEVACMMVLLKIARTKSGAFNGDCYVDGAGYMALAGELADDQAS